jgi:hypothetical protein
MSDQNIGQAELLARLDERTKAMQGALASTNTALLNEIAALRADINAQRNEISAQNARFDSKLNEEKTIIIARIGALETDISQKYVSKETFSPVQKIVYSTVGLILVSVVGALLSMVVK